MLRLFDPYDGGTMFLRNAGNYIPVDTAEHVRKLESSWTPPWELQISLYTEEFRILNSLSLIQLVDMSFCTVIWHHDTAIALSFSVETHVFKNEDTILGNTRQTSCSGVRYYILLPAWTRRKIRCRNDIHCARQQATRQTFSLYRY